MQKKRSVFFVLVLAGSMVLNVHGQGERKISIHGFGGWGYSKTDGNQYLIGTKDGSFRNSQFSLNVTALPYNNLTISTQLHLEELFNHEKMELDFAFIEWAFSDLIKLRMGKIKCPFGIYSEIFDLGTSRPFYALPQAVYGTRGVVNKSYFGAGITGGYYTKSGWGLEYDLYGGEMTFQDWYQQNVVQLPDPPYMYEVKMHITAYNKDMLGGRLVLETPLDNLKVGVSCFYGYPTLFMDDVLYEEYFKKGRFRSLDFHVEYLTESFSMRSEYLTTGRIGGNSWKTKGYYLELSYKFLRNWQISALYDNYNVEDLDYIPVDQSQLEHEEYGLGLNYWFTPDLVLKVSYHIIDGNIFAEPESLLEAVAQGGLEHKTNVLIVGTQFSF